MKPRSEVEAVELWLTELLYLIGNALPSTSSPQVELKLRRRQELHRKRQTDQLSQPEEEEYRQLELWQKALPPALEDPGQRRVAQALQEAVEHQNDRLKEIS